MNFNNDKDPKNHCINLPALKYFILTGEKPQETQGVIRKDGHGIAP